ncbi:hypothetical protein GCM10023189_45550 [Nibrella saemangeumensis]|uniref:Calcineurin-like phosphoesterase domain-containing protein n=1 Tax=Nibrella saemangeumensis TaxID=1084526 RepID=A0ABP8NCW5_9BACT
MKILCISDTHGQHRHFTDQIQSIDADVLVHAGDITAEGSFLNLKDFLTWLKAFNHIPHKVFVGGNHDRILEVEASYLATLRDLLARYNIWYLHHESITIDGVNFYGSSYSPEFMNWHFMYRRGEPAQALWDMIPQNTDVLITHTPPFGILDEVIGWGGSIRTGGNVGCRDLLDRVNLLNPMLHVFGHIHNGYGCTSGKNVKTSYVNAALLNEQYRPVNKPILVEI